MSSPVRMLGAETPMNTSAPGSTSRSAPVRRSAFVRSATAHQLGGQPLAIGVDDAVLVGDHDVLASLPPAARSRIAMPAAPAPESTTRTSASSLPTTLQRVEQGGEDHDRGAVLVVVEDGDVEAGAQPALDLEAARRRDVLEVDAGEHRGDQLDGADDLVDVLRVEADREGVDAGEPLEQRGLALHHRQRRDRPEVAQPEDRGAVGDHRDGVALDGQPAGVGGFSARARQTRATPGV